VYVPKRPLPFIADSKMAEGAQPPSKSPEAEEKGKGKNKSSTSVVKPFTLKKWNAVAMWRWDVECDTCAICRVQVQGERPRH